MSFRAEQLVDREPQAVELKEVHSVQVSDEIHQTVRVATLLVALKRGVSTPVHTFDVLFRRRPVSEMSTHRIQQRAEELATDRGFRVAFPALTHRLS
jgi:hypothetical protein